MKNMKTQKTKHVGVSTFSLLGLIFVTLKLTGYIDWSWFWVLLPFFAPLAIVVFIIAFALICSAIQTFFKK